MWMETVKLRRCSCCAVRTNRPILSPKGGGSSLNAKQIQAAVEAVLFAAGEPLELSRLAQALEVNEGLMEQILKNLEAQLDERGSGLCLLRLATGISFAPARNSLRVSARHWKSSATLPYPRPRLKCWR